MMEPVPHRSGVPLAGRTMRRPAICNPKSLICNRGNEPLTSADPEKGGRLAE